MALPPVLRTVAGRRRAAGAPVVRRMVPCGAPGAQGPARGAARAGPVHWLRRQEGGRWRLRRRRLERVNGGRRPRRYEALVGLDQAYLLHPQHHPADHAAPVIFARGEGAILWDVQGRRYIDGLSCLWNVNVGHGRRELAEAGARQMERLAFANAYAGSSNEPAITLAARLRRPRPRPDCAPPSSPPAGPNPTTPPSRRPASTGACAGSRRRRRCSPGSTATTG